jgi:hypothetical protein
MTQHGELLQFCSRETTKGGMRPSLDPSSQGMLQISQIRRFAGLEGHGVIWAARSLRGAR